MITVLQILDMLLTVLSWIIIIQAILSWLVVFNVINTHSEFMRGLLYGLGRLTEPLYRPIRRILPDFGGIDFSPLVVLLIVQALKIVIRNAEMSLILSSYS